MPRSKSSARWLREHFTDPYVKKAQQDGYRSRAAYKLIELQTKDKLCKPGMTVIDLGAAPGGWSQLAAQWVGDTGQVIASDILAMQPLVGVQFIQGDFHDESTVTALFAAMQQRRADLIICDMAPNTTGTASVDQSRCVYLAELALDLTQRLLKHNGSFVVKIFQGEGFDAYLKQLRGLFKQVLIRKPDASRARSREVYLVAKGYGL